MACLNSMPDGPVQPVLPLWFALQRCSRTWTLLVEQMSSFIWVLVQYFEHLLSFPITQPEG